MKEEWKQNKCGARNFHAIMKRKGFGVSHLKIEKVMISEKFQKPFSKRKKLRRYKRYEWSIPNYMWHIDCHIIKSEKLKGENVIVYLDDCSRKIKGYTLGDMVTKNLLFALYNAIVKCNKVPYCLNSDRKTQFYPNKRNRQGKANHIF